MQLTQLSAGNYKRLASACGFHYSHVSRLLRGQRNFSIIVAARIAAAAGVSIDQLWNHVVTHPDFNQQVNKFTARVRERKLRRLRGGKKG